MVFPGKLLHLHGLPEQWRAINSLLASLTRTTHREDSPVLVAVPSHPPPGVNFCDAFCSCSRRLLTLTAFPFRVLHVNEAFARLYSAGDVVGESFYNVFCDERRQTHTFPTLSTCPTLLGTYQDEVVRLMVASDIQSGVPCTIKVRPVYEQTGRSEPGLLYYAVTVTPLPMDYDVVPSGRSVGGGADERSKPPLVVYLPTSSMSPSIPITRQRKEGSSNRHGQEPDERLFYLP
jgi:hypothetical protein